MANNNDLKKALLQAYFTIKGLHESLMEEDGRYGYVPELTNERLREIETLIEIPKLCVHSCFDYHNEAVGKWFSGLYGSISGIDCTI